MMSIELFLVWNNITYVKHLVLCPILIRYWISLTLYTNYESKSLDRFFFSFYTFLLYIFKYLLTDFENLLLLYIPVDMSENIICISILRGSRIENQVVYDFKCVYSFISSVTPWGKPSPNNLLSDSKLMFCAFIVIYPLILNKCAFV